MTDSVSDATAGSTTGAASDTSSPSAAALLEKAYRPADHEPAISARWAASGCFHTSVTPEDDRPPFSIVIPPPNVTAALHMGHALNNTLQDILTRYHRMRDFNTLWMPGTDHAGIATQSVVDKRLQAQGKPALKEHKKMEVAGENGREKFVAQIQAWKDEFEATITDQLKLMGSSCDFDRQRFTMDDTCAKAVREAFFRLFKDGLIYRGKRLVNWDPVSQTALSDDEVEMEDVGGNFYYMKYPVCDAAGEPTGEHVTVATTRPETMLGDTAVAVNPNDEPRKHFIGQFVKLPIVGRVIPIVGDDYVVVPDADSDDSKAKMASGFLKVTPAHDPNDYDIGQRHDLDAINVMAPDASISKDHGWLDFDTCNAAEILPFLGLSREDARREIVKWFKANDLMGEVKPYRHAVGHSYRSHVPVEPYLSDQWYVKVTDERLAGAALRAMAPDQRQDSEGPVWRDDASSSSSSSSSSHSGTGFQPVSGPKGQISERLIRQRRHLPHWQLGGSTYFVTFRVQNGTLVDEERLQILNAALHWNGERLDMHAVVIMPDHVHLLFTPQQKAPGHWHSLSEILHSIKSFSAQKINAMRGATGQLWQDESFDRIVRDEEELHEKWNYICNNPVKKGLSNQPEAYPWLWEDSAGAAEDRQDACPTGEEEKSDIASELRFTPERYAKTFQNWHENIRDWCISRQLWWGHRIPVFHKHVVISPDQIGQGSPFEEWELGDVINGEMGDVAAVRVVETSTGENVDFRTWGRIGRESVGEYELYICCRTEKDADWFRDRFAAFGFEQDPDVLDTWFSSALWPLSTMGWPDGLPDEGHALLEKFNPTSVLCTAREIITLWVSRMVMFNTYFNDGKLPFTDVYIHAMIQDGHGQKMSKSLGNGVDPRDIIASHGSDAMRFTLCQMTTQTQDVRMPVDMVDPFTGESFEPKFITAKSGYKVAAPLQERNGKKFVSSYGVASGEVEPTADLPAAMNSSGKFDVGRNFTNKIWNATRFVLEAMSTAEPDAQGDPLATTRSVPDRWILSQTARTIASVEKSLAAYDFHAVANTLYHFVWNDLCDWYIESVKHVIRAPEGAQSRRVLATVLDVAMRLLHPVMPFATERLFEALNTALPKRGVQGLDPEESELLATARWPKPSVSLVDEDAEERFDRMRNVVGMIREARAAAKVPPREKIDFSLKMDQKLVAHLHDALELVQSLTQTQLAEAGPDVARPEHAAVVTGAMGELYLHVEVDAGEEIQRLSKRKDELVNSIKTLDGRLSNKKYTDKAPSHLVQQTRDQRAQAEAELVRVEAQLVGLGPA